MASRIGILLTVVGLTLSVSVPTPAQTADQNRRIANNEIVTWIEDSGQPLRTCVAIGLINASPDKVFQAICDFPNLPKVFRMLSSARVLKRQGNESDVRYTMPVPWPFAERVAVTHATADPVNRILRFHVIGGNVKVYEGSMSAQPWGNGRTKFIYRTRTDPGVAILPAWVVTWGTRTMLPGVIRDLAHYVGDTAR